MKRSFALFLLFFSLFFASCRVVPHPQFRWYDPVRDPKIEQLQVEIARAEEQKREAVAQKESEIRTQFMDRISIGGSQAIAALSTLRGVPYNDKFIFSSIEALKISEKVFAPYTRTEDLLSALAIQSQLLSEQAEIIRKAQQELAELSRKIDDSVAKEESLRAEKERIEQEKTSIITRKEAELASLEREKEKIRQEQHAKDAALAEKWRKENSFLNRINPFRDLWKFVVGIFWWAIVFVILGFILKILSVAFPGVNVVQVIVKSIGRIVGGFLKLVFGLIPDLFRGMNAIEYEKYQQEKVIADNSVMTIQKFKEKYPDLYNAELKPLLKKYHKDDPRIDAEIEAKLRDLHLK